MPRVEYDIPECIDKGKQTEIMRPSSENVTRQTPDGRQGDGR